MRTVQRFVLSVRFLELYLRDEALIMGHVGLWTGIQDATVLLGRFNKDL
jgi:hypothetical protein